MKEAIPIIHYCQKCLAANPLGQDFCDRCGTRLMIVVEPSSQRYEVTESSISTDEHLLERISAAENRINRLSERLERCLDLLLRNAQNSYFDRSLMKALIEILSDDGLVEPERLEVLWNAHRQDDIDEEEASVRRDALRLAILASATGPKRDKFEELVNEGFLLIDDYQVDRGIGVLRKAADLGSNSVLELYIGEYFFRNGKTKLARTHLQKAYDSSPENDRLSTLLGLTCADDGDLEPAKELLKRAIERGAETFAAHYGLGRLCAAENDWAGALSEFKRALNTRPSPEAHYVLASVYYQLERDNLATRHVRRAISLDGNYGEAFYLLSLIHKRNGNDELAREALAKSHGQKNADSGTQEPGNAPLFEPGKRRTRRLMTGADKRLARTLREDALRDADPSR